MSLAAFRVASATVQHVFPLLLYVFEGIFSMGSYVSVASVPKGAGLLQPIYQK